MADINGGRRRFTFLCYGDSNTHGTRPMRHPSDLGRYRVHRRWPGRLAAALSDSAKVIEAGHPGRTTVFDDPVEGPHKNGLAILPAVLESHRPIDVVILMLGTNDVKRRFSVTPWDISRGVERLVLAIGASNCGRDGMPPGVFLVSPAPIMETGCLAEQFEGGAEKSRRLATHLAEIARFHGCGFLDAGAHASVDPVDGVHLSSDGHAALADALAAALRPLID